MINRQGSGDFPCISSQFFLMSSQFFLMSSQFELMSSQFFLMSSQFGQCCDFPQLDSVVIQGATINLRCRVIVSPTNILFFPQFGSVVMFSWLVGQVLGQEGQGGQVGRIGYQDRQVGQVARIGCQDRQVGQVGQVARMRGLEYPIYF